MIKWSLAFYLSLCIFLSSSPLFSKVEKIKYQTPKFEYFEFKDVCSYFKKDPTIIEAKNQVYLDCMGEMVSSQEFCHQKFQDEKNYVRAFVDQSEKKVVCQFAKSAELTFSCADSKTHCSESEKTCDSLRMVFAANKKLYHASDLKGQVKCYYE